MQIIFGQGGLLRNKTSNILKDFLFFFDFLSTFAFCLWPKHASKYMWSEYTFTQQWCIHSICILWHISIPTYILSITFWYSFDTVYTVCDYIQSTYTTGEVLKRNVDRRMKIGYDLKLLLFQLRDKHDDATCTPSSIWATTTTMGLQRLLTLHGIGYFG